MEKDDEKLQKQLMETTVGAYMEARQLITEKK